MAREVGGTRLLVGPVGDMRKALAGTVSAAVSKAVAEGRLPPAAEPALADLGLGHVEVPKDAGHGDFASAAALRLAGACRTSPRRIAEEIQAGLDLAGLPVERTEVAGAGFLNFYLGPLWLNRVVADILKDPRAYGRSDVGRGERIQVEFVSANPTGPLGVVNARAATVGDTLASLLSAIGCYVEREYYINDTGGQIERLGRSLEARWLELQGKPAEIPEGGYHGDYIIDIAKEFEAAHGDEVRKSPLPNLAERMGRFVVERMVQSHRQRLADFGVEFDVWFSQASLAERNADEETIKVLEAGGHVYRKDGAVWLRTTDFGDDKDRVIVTAKGRPTYFLADISYHKDKYARGFQRVIDLWGPDHHGYIARMKAAVQALGHPADALEVLLVQWVRLVEGGQAARMSKRRGQIVPMEDLVEEVGRDAARFFFLLRSHDSHLDFDLDLAKLRTADNPVYYVQYAHARVSSILRQPGAKDWAEVIEKQPAKVAELGLEVLREPAEVALIRKLADFPDEVAGAALAREPHRLPRYATELATAFHKFYDTCRVLTDEECLRRARLALVAATRAVLANALALCGVSAPERM